jgi:hypothetical protein
MTDEKADIFKMMDMALTSVNAFMAIKGTAIPRDLLDFIRQNAKEADDKKKKGKVHDF